MSKEARKPIDYVIAFAPPGTSLRHVASRVRKLGHHVMLEDVEDVMCRVVPETRNALDGIALKDGGKKISMYDVTWNLPRFKVKRLWEEAVAHCLNRFVAASDSSINVLTGHVVYYGGQRDEFYSVFNPVFLSAGPWHQHHFRVTHVVVFVDDVFDMYLRLTRRDTLFDPAARVSDFLRQEALSREPRATGFTRGENSSLCLEWQVGVLSHLLNWRHLEIVFAENLALQLGARFAVFGLKQQLACVLKWLETGSTSVYLSHPISGARKHRAMKGRWPSVVSQINSCQKAFLRNKVVCIMPTGIDELRFAAAGQGGLYSGRLEERWPLPAGLPSLAYEFPPGSCGVDHKGLLDPKRWNGEHPELLPSKTGAPKEVRSTFIRTLLFQIRVQIASRDHLLVSHCDAMCVFRDTVPVTI